MAMSGSHIVTVSELLAKELCSKSGIRREKVTTIHNGVEAGKFNGKSNRNRILEEIGLAKGEKIIGAVGNIKLVKGYDILLRSFSKILRAEGANVVLVLVGEIFDKQQGYKELLDGLIKELRLDGKVYFLGYREDIPELLQVFDLYVLPSRSEGLSISLLEAMASRKPIVATDVGMNSYLIKNGVSGRIVPSEDAESFADAMSSILKDREKAEQYGKAAAREFEENYSSKRMGAKYEEIYRKVLGVK
jgi:glycosyltransferase involved in cell wall biosynthesis